MSSAGEKQSPRRTFLAVPIWAVLVAVIAVPIVLAALSPLLSYRSAPYIVGGFAGILGLAVLFIQPLFAAGYLPGQRLTEARKWHRRAGWAIVMLVALHIGGLYLTSPPDTLDALLLVAPTPFSVYGVIAMWGIVLTAILVSLRRRIGVRTSIWRMVHNGLALIVVAATVVHALQIEGTMEPISKWALCLAVLLVTSLTLLDLRIVKPLLRWRSGEPGAGED